MSESTYTAAVLPRRLAHDRSQRSGAASALLLAALCVAALALTWVVAELVPAAHVRDAVLLHRFTLLDSGQVDTAARALPRLLEPYLFTIWGIALVLFALARERPRVALAVAMVMALAPLSAELLKPLLAHPHASIGSTQVVNAASWPSGHSTAAAALALCAVLVSPARLRPLIGALGGLFVLAVGAALLIRAWHMPSDVLGGYLLAALWMALAVAALRASQRRWPARR
jgi:membrane-associated phospholipid phosphatase